MGILYPDTKDESYIWSYGCGGGKFESCVGIGNTGDLHGRVLHTETFQDSNIGSFDISTLPKGIYIAKGIFDNNKMVTKICLQ